MNKFIKDFQNFNTTPINKGFKNFEKNWSDFLYNILGEYNQEELEEEYEMCLRDINKLIIKQPLIYRKILVNQEWLETFESQNEIHTGLYWTLNKSIAKNWMGTDIYDNRFEKSVGKISILLTANFPKPEHIDIDATIAHWIVSGEEEVRLEENSPINLYSIEYKNNLLPIKDKVFFS